MRLQADSELVIGHESIRLRPTLGAAFRLEQKYHGFHNLFNAVASGSVSALSDVIKEGCGQTSALTDYLDSSSEHDPLVISLDLIIPQVCTFLLALAGDELVIKDDSPTIEQITFLEYHTRLYRLATGWLGWSPEIAWAATPAEILEAQKGRVEMLKAVFGGKQEDGADETITDLRSARDRLNALGDSSVTDMRDVP
ncbi:hypothetical protein V1279_003120 [Bradyrhizobium sp. AZCC 1610]|uniref:hypothetical protein n=1 Tax=Bradyrhizobium sp. AZCC 1610 TaxID=3117020 RepID=UPI002FF30C01